MTYEIALLERDATKLVVVPVNSAFETQTKEEQEGLVSRLKAKVEESKFEGFVVPVWQGYTGRLKFVAPEEIGALLRGLDWGFVLRNINASLAWD